MPPDDANNDQTQSFVALTSGTAVSHYKILEKIGAGGMGEVYLAHDTELDREVALKFLSPHLCQDPDCRTRFRREAQAAAKLSHPNIVTVYDVSEFQGRPFFAMERVEGVSLRDAIKQEKLSVAETVAMTMQLCEGLQDAHEAGIIHRDIKPSNIIVDRKGRPRLLDFGLAAVKGTDKLTKTGSTLGTAGYMSPEQAEGKQTDQRSDLFSLGIVLYEMIAGRRPFDRESDVATSKAIVTDSPEPLARYKSDLPEGIQKVVDRALEKNLETRYQTAAGMLSDMKRVVATEYTALREREAGLSARQRKVHRRLLPVSVVALIVLLALVFRPWRLEIGSEQPAMAGPRRLAVLYLKNLGSPNDEYLSYGITEDLTIDLTRLGNIGVAPMRSVLKHRDSNDDLGEIARQLDVSMLLDGSISKEGNRIRVSAQLIDITEGVNLWADRWEETLENLPHIKDSLAQGIARTLAINPTVVSAAQVGMPETSNPIAYDYYLRGKFAFERKVDESDVEAALGLYRKALALDHSLLAARKGIASVLILRGEYDQAGSELNMLLSEAEERGLAADMAGALVMLAELEARRAHYDESLIYSEQALQITRDLGDLAGEANALFIMIDAYKLRGMNIKARELLERVLEITQGLDDRSATARSLKALADIDFLQGNNREAVLNYEKALAILTDLGDRHRIATVFNNLGVVYMWLGETENMQQNIEKASEIYHQLGNLDGIALAASNIGDICRWRGEYEEALSNYEKAMEIAIEVGDQDGIASGYLVYGIICEDKGEYAKALNHYTKAKKIWTEVGDQAGMMQCLFYIGDIHDYLGQFEKALSYYDEAFRLATEQDDAEGIATWYHNTATVFESQGNYRQALNHYETSLQTWTEQDDQEGMAISYFDIGKLYEEQGVLRKSLEFNEKGASLYLSNGFSTDSLWALSNLASPTIALGGYDEVIATLTGIQARASQLGNPQIITEILRSLGRAYFYKDQHQKSLESLYEAVKVDEKVGLQKSLSRDNFLLGEFYYHLDLPDSCRKYSAEANGIASKIGYPAVRLPAAAYLAALEARFNDYSEAVRRLRELAEASDDLGNAQVAIAIDRLLGSVLLRYGSSKKDRETGRQALLDVLSLAKEIELAHETEWINWLLETYPGH